LENVVRPGQYLGNEWGALRKPFEEAQVRLTLAFPDMYELGMSNFGLKILYQIVNKHDRFLCDRAYAPGSDMEELMRAKSVPLWAWESRRPLAHFDLVGFSLQYELTYTNVLNMLELAGIPIKANERTNLFPLIFGGGPSAVNPEPMAEFMDFFIIGDGEKAMISVLETVDEFKKTREDTDQASDERTARRELLTLLATKVDGIYVPSLYERQPGSVVVKAIAGISETQLPERVFKQVVPLNDENQPTANLVPYLSLVHDRDVLEVRRGCDRGCRFCQPGYTFLPVRERSADDLLRLSKEALGNSGHQEYSMLSLCVSDYTSLRESARALNEEHSARRTSLSFPSQRADRMNLDVAEELKAVRKTGITLAPEAGSERLRAVINKGLSHQQIMNAIEAAYQSGWSSIKLYFMCCLPTEQDEDLVAIVDILKEATNHCRVFRKADPAKYRRDIEFTCTISNFVPKPFTPFQWFGQVSPEETSRKHRVLRDALREARMKNVQLNTTAPQISLLEAVISRGGREMSQLIYTAWRSGCTFDAWDDRLQPQKWHDAASKLGWSLEELACTPREVGSEQPWDIVHIGLHTWWLVKEWEKAMETLETPNCTENLCHACGVCTELKATHLLAQPNPAVMKRNPFVKELSANDKDPDSHPSLFFMKPQEQPGAAEGTKIRFQLHKTGDLRFISHLDLQTLITRAARRAYLTVAYSQGFNPQPKMALAAALPLFQESLAEVGEMELAETIDVEEFRTRINRQLPIEIQLTDVRRVDGKSASLAAHLSSATYRAVLAGHSVAPDFIAAVKERVDWMLSQQSITVTPPVPEAKGSAPAAAPSPRDIRSGILALSVTNQSPLTLEFEIAHGSKMHVKPSELLGCVLPPDTAPVAWRITRLAMKAADQTPLLNVQPKTV
jgi:radical SAM family uncharacterized protein/radical SAM-linked protein